MSGGMRWTRVLTILGLLAIVAGVVDPLEGSVVILAGSALVAVAAWVSRSRHRATAGWGLGLATIGVAVLFALSAAGGVGGTTGRSMLWLLAVLPYPAGAILALVTGVRMLFALSDAGKAPVAGADSHAG